MVLAASTTWYAARAGGFVAYLLLSATVAVGLLLSGRAQLERWPRFTLEDLHRWRRLHYLNFAVWGMALVHGLTAGADALTTWALLLYAGSAWLVLALLVHRVSPHWGTPQPTERST